MKVELPEENFQVSSFKESGFIVCKEGGALNRMQRFSIKFVTWAIQEGLDFRGLEAEDRKHKDLICSSSKVQSVISHASSLGARILSYSISKEKQPF
jgi:hypothetical protein